MPEADPAHAPMRSAEADRAPAAKAALRAIVRAARRHPETPEAVEQRTARALEASSAHHTIAVYASIGDEPDAWPLIDALHAAGRTLLLPVLGRRPDGTPRREPDWAHYAGRPQLRPGYAGVPEPSTEPLGADGLGDATLIWCAALAATPAGDRLGTGGGWYDRALLHARADAVVGVLLRDSEVKDALPVESFDRPVGLIVTEARTIRTPFLAE
jgi:5-formyltetrahydrofolate cyclo-ligase